MRILSKTVSNDKAGMTVKQLLRSDFGISSSMIKSLKWREFSILLNSNPVRIIDTVSAGDILSVDISDYEKISEHITPVNYPLSILFEDDDLLIIDKPAGIAVHSASLTSESITIAGAVSYYLNNAPFHPVNRLDRGVTGIMVIAKNGYTHQRLMKVLHSDHFRREYLGVTEEVPNPLEGDIFSPIGRDNESILKRVISDNGLPSHTHYSTIATNGKKALVRLRPYTGRTHQLRLHMSSIGCPLVGDWLYGTENHTLITRPALHSHELWLTHPIIGSQLHVLSPLPDDMKKITEDFYESM